MMWKKSYTHTLYWWSDLLGSQPKFPSSSSAGKVVDAVSKQTFSPISATRHNFYWKTVQFQVLLFLAFVYRIWAKMYYRIVLKKSNFKSFFSLLLETFEWGIRLLKWGGGLANKMDALSICEPYRDVRCAYFWWTMFNKQILFNFFPLVLHKEVSFLY